MLLTIARSLSFLLLLPVVGIAVAAATVSRPVDQEGDAPVAAEPLPRGVVVDGRQDDSSYNHLVRLDAQGRFHGELIQWSSSGESTPAAGLPIRISQRGLVIARTQTDAAGHFAVDGLAPGVYSVFGQNSQAIFATGVYVVSNGSTEAGVDRLTNVVVSGENVAEVNRIRRFNLPSVPLLAEEENNANAFAKVMRQSFLSSGPAGNVVMEQVAEEAASKAPSLGVMNQVVSLTNGELSGQLSQVFGSPIDFQAIHCFLVQNGATVAEVPCDAQGSFAFTGVTPGIYSFVAAGTGGFAAIGLNVVSDQAAPVQAGMLNPIVFANVSTVAAQVSVGLVSQEDSGDDEGEESEEEEAPFAFEPGFPGGGSVGGGGGGGGGAGGIGAAGALAIGGLAAAVIASDDDDPQFASPFFP